MILLAIDSSMGTSVALVTGEGSVLAEETSADKRGHAENIGLLMERCLQRAEVFSSEVTGVVMGTGPGPYTGLRVGMAAAQAFAVSRSLPLYPVVSHDAEGWTRGDCVVVTDARRGEVAYSVYQDLGAMKRTQGPALARPENLDASLGEYASLPRVSPDTISAAGLAQVALSFIEQSLEFPGPSPVYLRAPDVTVAS